MARTNMGTQRTATRRNQQAEEVSNFVLKSVLENLENDGLIQEHWVLEQQVLFASDISRDKWDHRAQIQKSQNSPKFEVWAQTTCYKGHDTGITESNKTYEVRETLSEALCLRARHEKSNQVRLVHITYGNPDYVYSWFRPLKNSIFDLSIYMHSDSSDIFDLIEDAIGNCKTEVEMNASLQNHLKEKSVLGVLLQSAVASLRNWLSESEIKVSTSSALQSSLLARNLEQISDIEDLLSNAQGANIKKSIVDCILSNGVETFDPAVMNAAQGIMIKKPFLKTAKEQIQDWDKFVDDLAELIDNNSPFSVNLKNLWQVESQSLKESARRILIKLHSDDDVDYVQDVGVLGVSEHNLYGGNHSDRQADEIIKILAGRLVAAKISGNTLLEAIESRGKDILRSQLYFEARNGTASTSSFDFIVQHLESKKFKVTSPKESDMSLVGYHSEITNQTVRPYTNFKIVKNQVGETLCLLKAKFFSAAEFDRRCKEEGFVALSLQNRWDGKAFEKRFDIPIIMCVDMPEGLTPPALSVRKLLAMGWEVVFGVDSLLEKLKA